MVDNRDRALMDGRDLECIRVSVAAFQESVRAMLFSDDVADSIRKPIQLAPHVDCISAVDAPDVHVNIATRTLTQASASDCRLDALA